MTQLRWLRILYVAALSLIGLALFSTTVAAQSVKVKGLIKGRDGDTMILQASDSPTVNPIRSSDTPM
jgi:hypothetical protein